MGFREVSVVEVREVARGHGLRQVAERSGVDSKTAGRYVVTAEAAGLSRDAGPEAVTDELVGAVVACGDVRVGARRRPRPSATLAPSGEGRLPARASSNHSNHPPRGNGLPDRCAMNGAVAVASLRVGSVASALSAGGLMTGRIVVGIDGSQQSGSALEWAAARARLGGEDLELINVYRLTPELDFYGVRASPIRPWTGSSTCPSSCSTQRQHACGS